MPKDNAYTNKMLLFSVSPEWQNKRLLPPVAKQGREIFKLIKEHGPLRKLSLMSLIREKYPDTGKHRRHSHLIKRYQRILAEGGYIEIIDDTTNYEKETIDESRQRIHGTDGVPVTEQPVART